MMEQNIKKDVLLSTIGGYFVAALNFVVNLILIRYLSAELYGLFSYIVNQSRRILRFLDFSFVELILISKKRDLKLSELTESYILHSIVRLLIVLIGGWFAAWYTDNLKILSVVSFLIVYTNVRYFYIFGIVHFYEAYFNTKTAQIFYTLSAFIFLLFTFLLPFVFETTLYNFAFSFFIASLFIVVVISSHLLQNSGYKNIKFSKKVFNALKSHSLFLQLPILFGVITKFIQETLIIVEQSAAIFAFYSVSLLIGSIAVIGARGAIRPLGPYLWSKDKISLRPYIVIGLFMYAFAITGAYFSGVFENILLLLNNDYQGVSIYLSLGVILAISLAYSQIIQTFIKGFGLIKHLSIVAAFINIISLVLTLLAYYYLNIEFFAINLLIIETIVTILNIVILIIIYKLNIRFIDESDKNLNITETEE